MSEYMCLLMSINLCLIIYEYIHVRVDKYECVSIFTSACENM